MSGWQKRAKSVKDKAQIKRKVVMIKLQEKPKPKAKAEAGSEVSLKKTTPPRINKKVHKSIYKDWF